MKRNRESPRDEICNRLRFTREALGRLVQSSYAEDAGLSPNAYNNYENGFRIGLDAAIKLCNTYELSLDWIYFGERANLPGSVIDRFDKHERSLKPGGSKSGSKRPPRAA